MNSFPAALAKPFRAMLPMLLACLPAQACTPAVSFHAELHGGVHTTGLQMSVGMGAGGMGADGVTGLHLECLTFEYLQTRDNRHHELRIHAIGPELHVALGEGWGFQAGAVPVLSLGGITGTGAGVQIHAGLHYKYFGLGTYAWAIKGRANPWNGGRTSREAGLYLRVGL